jgi:hypothetical protein
MSRQAYSCAVVAAAIVAYFFVFPEDLAFVERLLMLTQQVAAGAWALLIAMVLVAGAVRIWGRRPAVVAPVERGGPS